MSIYTSRAITAHVLHICQSTNANYMLICTIEHAVYVAIVGTMSKNIQSHTIHQYHRQHLS